MSRPVVVTVLLTTACLMAGVLVATVPAGTDRAIGGTAPRAAAELVVGVSPGFTLLGLRPARLRSDLADVRRLGADRVRVDVAWAAVERRRGRRDWTDVDRVLRASRAAGLEVLAVVGYRPRWTQRLDGSAAIAAFGRFVAAAARRHGDRVAAWEIWNEPNLAASWGGPPDARVYARVVAAAAPAIREHDPGAAVVVGALAPGVDGRLEVSPETFLGDFYAADPDLDDFDAVSVHPYSYPALPSGRQPWNTFARLPDIHAVMDDAGDADTQLWLTEYGAPTGSTSRSVTPRRQARMVVGAVRRAAELPYVAALYLYSLRDLRGRASDPENHFGLLHRGGRPKPAYQALRRELRRELGRS